MLSEVYGVYLERGKGKKRRPMTVTCVLIVLIAFCLLVVQPVLAYTVIPSIEHSGVELYEEGTYLDYEKADEFKSAISELSFLKKAQVRDFSYKNSILRDSLYFGRFPDYFAIELFLGDNYESAKEEVVLKSFSVISVRDLELYYLGECTDGDSFCIALYDERQTAICVLLTDCEYAAVDMVLIRHFPLPGM